MFRGIQFIPSGTKIPFLSYRKLTLISSGIAIAVSLLLLVVYGLNFGIDFKGGTLMQVRSLEGPADIAEIRRKISKLGLGDVQIQNFGSPRDVLIRVETQKGGEKAQQAVVVKVKKALGKTMAFERTEVVGPTVSKELVEEGILAVISAILAVLVYIWFRFEWQFAVGAVAALIHDVILTLGIFSLLQLEFNLSIIAAILTIVGYSLNDTVVVFDRVRENLRKYKKMPLLELLDLSVNETLSRTVLTSVTTMLALASLYIFGGEVIRGFTFAMMWGVVVGTYSSVVIASPVLSILNVTRAWSGLGGAKPKQPSPSRA